jgi:hypothetical protein
MTSIARTCLLTLLVAGPNAAQTPPASEATTPPPSIAKSIGLVVFPAKGQTADAQAADESYCMNWAKQQTGIDPTAPAQASSSQATATKEQGGAVKGAAKGAVAGTAIGAIAGDTGKGAAIGATAGALGGRRQQKKANEAAEKEAQQQAQASQQASNDQFKKAAAACLEGKGYTVK